MKLFKPENTLKSCKKKISLGAVRGSITNPGTCHRKMSSRYRFDRCHYFLVIVDLKLFSSSMTNVVQIFGRELSGSNITSEFSHTINHDANYFGPVLLESFDITCTNF
jgi:hypothetical protein